MKERFIPLLKRLSNDHLLESYLKESTEGPPRKYYHITSLGLARYEALLEEWTNFSESVNTYLNPAEGILVNCSYFINFIIDQ
mgnify:CR=1 FL=1